MANAFTEAGLEASQDWTEAIAMIVIGILVVSAALAAISMPLRKWKDEFRRNLRDHPEDTLLEWEIPCELRVLAERTERRVEIVTSVFGILATMVLVGLFAVDRTSMDGAPAIGRFFVGMFLVLLVSPLFVGSWFVQAWFRSGTKLGGKGATVQLRRDGWIVNGKIAGWTCPGQRLVALELNKPNEFMRYWRLNAEVRTCISYGATDDPRPVDDGEKDSASESTKRQKSYRVPVPEDRLDDVREAMAQIIGAGEE